MSHCDPEALLTQLAQYLGKVQAQLPRAVRASSLGWAQATIEDLRVLVEQVQTAETDLVNIWRAAEAEREHYEDLSSLTSDGFVVTDYVGVILEASATALSLLNVPAAFARRKPLAVYVLPEDRPIFRTALSSMQRQESGDWILRMIPRDAETPRVVHASARVSRYEVGDLKCVRWLLSDVTEQGLRDQELLDTRRELTLLRERADLLRLLTEERARLALAMAAADMGHWEWDLDTGNAVWDEVHNRIVGIAPEQTLGTFDELLLHVHEDDRKLLTDVVRRAGAWCGPPEVQRAQADRGNGDATEADGNGAAENHSFEIEFRTLHDDGAIRWAIARGRAYCERDGRRRVLGVIRDTTVARQVQAELLKANQQLEQRVRQRTRVLMDTQGQLQSLAAQLSRAEERERRRIAVGLHDRISQPLAMARMALGQLRAASAKSGNGAVTNGLVAPLADLESLLSQAIEESRTLTFELSPPILHELGLKAALEWLAEQSQRRHGLRVKLRVRPEVDDVAASTDLRGLLFQAARELVTNIVKHARARNAILSARRCGSYLRLTVVDDGQGFEPQRSGEHAPRSDRPRGFGLFNLKTRAEQIGGRLRLRSRVGADGSVVSLIVPVVIPHVVPEDEPPNGSADRRLTSQLSTSPNHTDGHEQYNRTHRRRSSDRSSGTPQPVGQPPGPERRGRGGRRPRGDRDGKAA